MATVDGFTEQDLEEGAAHGEDFQESDESQDNNPSEDSYWSRLKRLIDERVPEESEKFELFKKLSSQFINKDLENMRKPSDIICEFERKKTVEFGKGYHTDILQKLLQKIGHDELALILKLNEPQTIMGGPPPITNLNNKLRRTVNDPEVKKKIFRGRVMLVGAFGSGKTSTKRSLFDEKYEESHISTDGADIYGVDITRWICKENRTDRRQDLGETRKMLEDTLVSNMKKQSPIIYDDGDTEGQHTTIRVEDETQQSIDTDLKHRNETDIAFFSRIQERLREVHDVSKPDSHFSLWDFAGESLYYITHQAFLGNRVIYLLVTDLQKPLDEIVSAALCDKNSGEEHSVGEWQLKDFLCYWMNSIHSYRSRHEIGEIKKNANEPEHKISAPPVIIVGTKKDLLQEGTLSGRTVDELANDKFQEIKSHLGSNVPCAANKHIHDYIAIDNKSRDNDRASDSSVEELREMINKLSTDDYFCKEVPVKWVHLELLLSEQQKDTLELAETYDLGAKHGLDSKTVDDALAYLHSVGEVLHYRSIPELKDTVVVNVGWLVNLFKLLITQTMAHKKRLKDKHRIEKQVKALLTKGELHENLVNFLLQEKERQTDKDILLSTMELYDILFKVPKTSSDEKVGKPSDAEKGALYYVPCFLRKDLDEDEKRITSNKEEPCSPLYFHFEGNFLPEGHLYRLVVRCLRIWPDAQIFLFKDYARFLIPDQHFHFIIQLTGADIMLSVLTELEFQTNFTAILKHLRVKVEGELKNIIDTYSPGSSFGACVKCDNHTHEGDGCANITEKSGSVFAVCEKGDYVRPHNMELWYFKSQTPGATSKTKPEEEKHAVEKKRARVSARSLLYINDEWGTQKGGISTVNRLAAQLAIEIGKLTKVYVTALETSVTDNIDAKSKGIELMTPKIVSKNKPSLKWLNEEYTDYFPGIQTIPDLEVIIGHQPVTSQAALNIRNKWFPSKKVILFNRVIPEDTDVLKDEWTPSTVQKKEKELCDQAKKANVIFSVGHRIYSHFQNKFRSHRSIIHKLFIPQPDEMFFEIDIQKPLPSAKVQILTFGRVDGVQGLKGYDIAAAALGKVVKSFKSKNKPAYEIPVWKIRGIQQELDKQKEQENAENIMKLINDGHLQSIPAPYATQEEIREDLQESHLCLMPSRNEPFGMVGMEAMAAGLPVLITSNSGLADLLKEHSPESYSKVIVDTCLNDAGKKKTIKNWKKSIKKVLKHYDAALDIAQEMQTWLRDCEVIRKTHEDFKDVCCGHFG